MGGIGGGRKKEPQLFLLIELLEPLAVFREESWNVGDGQCVFVFASRALYFTSRP